MSMLVWYQVRSSFDAVSIGNLVWSVILTVCLMALCILSLFLFSPRESFIIYAALCAGFLMVLPFHVEYLLGVFLSFLMFAYAASGMRRGIKELLNISFSSLLFYGVSSLLIALATLFAFAGYFYPFNLKNVQISSGAFYYAVPLVEKFASAQFSYYRHDMTVDDFFAAGAEEAVTKQFGSVSKQARQLVDREAVKQRDGLGLQLGVTLTGKETIGDLFVAVSNMYLNRYLPTYKDFVPMVMAISVFVSIISVGFLINRLAVALAWLLFRGLKASGAVTVRKIATEKEVLTLM